MRATRVHVDGANIDTGSGRITLRLPADVSAEVEADTGSGGIELDLGEKILMREMSRDEVRFTLGNGDARIQLDTGSGRIRITR